MLPLRVMYKTIPTAVAIVELWKQVMHVIVTLSLVVENFYKHLRSKRMNRIQGESPLCNPSQAATDYNHCERVSASGLNLTLQSQSPNALF